MFVCVCEPMKLYKKNTKKINNVLKYTFKETQKKRKIYFFQSCIFCREKKQTRRLHLLSGFNKNTNNKR